MGFSKKTRVVRSTPCIYQNLPEAATGDSRQFFPGPSGGDRRPRDFRPRDGVSREVGAHRELLQADRPPKQRRFRGPVGRQRSLFRRHAEKVVFRHGGFRDLGRFQRAGELDFRHPEVKNWRGTLGEAHLQAFCKGPASETWTATETVVFVRKTSSSSTSTWRSRRSKLGECRSGLAVNHGTFPKPQSEGGVRFFAAANKPRSRAIRFSNWIAGVKFLHEYVTECESAGEDWKIGGRKLQERSF